MSTETFPQKVDCFEVAHDLAFHFETPSFGIPD
jgi:hypothetical protein